MHALFVRRTSTALVHPILSSSHYPTHTHSPSITHNLHPLPSPPSCHIHTRGTPGPTRARRTALCVIHEDTHDAKSRAHAGRRYSVSLAKGDGYLYGAISRRACSPTCGGAHVRVLCPLCILPPSISIPRIIRKEALAFCGREPTPSSARSLRRAGTARLACRSSTCSNGRTSRCCRISTTLDVPAAEPPVCFPGAKKDGAGDGCGKEGS